MCHVETQIALNINYPFLACNVPNTTVTQHTWICKLYNWEMVARNFLRWLIFCLKKVARTNIWDWWKRCGLDMGPLQKKSQWKLCWYIGGHKKTILSNLVFLHHLFCNIVRSWNSMAVFFNGIRCHLFYLLLHSYLVQIVI